MLFNLLSFCVKSAPNVSSVLQLWLGKARSCTSLAQYILVCPFLLSIYLFFLLSAVRFLCLNFDTPHPKFCSPSKPWSCCPHVFDPFVNMHNVPNLNSLF